jgi:hypothetical protein
VGKVCDESCCRMRRLRFYYLLQCSDRIEELMHTTGSNILSLFSSNCFCSFDRERLKSSWMDISPRYTRAPGWTFHPDTLGNSRHWMDNQCFRLHTLTRWGMEL